jgi:hypothetical protein
MTAEEAQRPVHPVDDEEPEEPDIDLDDLDESLRREAIGESTTVKIDGQIIHILHAGDWSQTAMRAATSGDWETWARESIIDDKEFDAWMEADLRNYQVEAIFQECGRTARMTAGKSRGHSSSRRRRNTKRR